MIGPPTEPPNWLRTKWSFIPAELENQSSAVKAWMRLYSNNEPCHLLVPLLSTVSVTNPPTLPYSALKSCVITRYSSIASGEIEVLAPPCPHAVPHTDTPPC